MSILFAPEIIVYTTVLSKQNEFIRFLFHSTFHHVFSKPFQRGFTVNDDPLQTVYLRLGTLWMGTCWLLHKQQQNWSVTWFWNITWKWCKWVRCQIRFFYIRIRFRTEAMLLRRRVNHLLNKKTWFIRNAWKQSYVMYMLWSRAVQWTRFTLVWPLHWLNS